MTSPLCGFAERLRPSSPVLRRPAPRCPRQGASPSRERNLEHAIAIVGMAGRFPGARTVGELWDNLSRGVESIRRFTAEELAAAGVSSDLLQDPDFVPASGFCEGIDRFDARFFGYTPAEAATIDPQHRLFLECAWEALESAGQAPNGLIGVFAGAAYNTYLLEQLADSPAVESLVDVATTVASDKDFLASRVSYKLDLRGPAVVVQTACSSSLVAIHLGCQSLLAGESDVVLAGGVSIDVPQVAGYLYMEDGIYSPDGHCRAFDAKAGGTVGGSGVGIVVLKRLEDALADRDRVVAVIRGSAINNDGADKVGYTAPSVTAQAEVIRAAHLVADVPAGSIGYVEAHGTATPLGDPIEVAASERRSDPTSPPDPAGSARSRPTWATSTPRPESPDSSRPRSA